MKKFNTEVNENTNSTDPELAKRLEMNRVKAVQDAIDSAKVKRELDGVVETKAETAAREKEEARQLKDASYVSKETKISKEDQAHLDARDGRVKAVQGLIDAAKVKRDEQEAAGLKETDGVKLDREAKEKKDLEEAHHLNKIEYFHIESTNFDMVALSEKLTEVINYINHA